jgi:hypothetical protein
MKLVLDIPPEHVEAFKALAEKHSLETFLRDCFAEFNSARQPLNIYVAKRYRDLSPSFRESKIVEVGERIQMADILYGATSECVELKPPTSRSFGCGVCGYPWVIRG